ncbi:MAG TPA: lanthionine synthetase C family protein, partial [Ktedonobacteraceae bacterium]
YLLWLAEPDQPVGRERWYIPPELLSTDHHREVSPGGRFDCGLAHGIPGPLAALALTWQAGYRYPGLRESIAYLAHWVEARQINAPWGIDWPGYISVEQATSSDDWQRLSPSRPSWCYGAPGVACSLWLAGQALEDERFCLLAIEALEAALRRPVTQRFTPSVHLCHGVAGQLQICLRFAHRCESSLIREHILVLVERILDAFNPTYALGFRDMDTLPPLDLATWLTGAPGIAMVLLAASTSVVPSWDRALAIA